MKKSILSTVAILAIFCLFSCEKEEDSAIPSPPGAAVFTSEKIESSGLKSSDDCIGLIAYRNFEFQRVYNKTNGITWETSVPSWFDAHYMQYHGILYLDNWGLLYQTSVQDNQYVRIERYQAYANYSGVGCAE